jgi:hypothetical protein
LRAVESGGASNNGADNVRNRGLYQMRVDTAGTSSSWGNQNAGASTAVVSAGESTLAQVASRLGVTPEALQSANPHITNPNALSPGLELRLPQANAGDTAKVVTQELPASASLSAATKRMEGNLDSLLMRAMLDSAGAASAPAGSGGITQEFPVARISGEGYTKAEKQELTDKLTSVYHRPEFQALNQKERQQVLLTLAGNPPLTQEKISNTLDLLDSLKNLFPAERKGALDGLLNAHCDPAYARSLKKLVDDPHFKSLPSAVKTAVLSQAGNYPDGRTVGNIDRLLQKDWFQSQSLPDMQRSLKTIARFSHNPNGDRNIIDNTLDKLLSPASDFKLEWQSLKGQGTLYGEAADKVLTLNKDLINAGNDKMVENYRSNHLSLNTVAHEVNHLVNHDEVHDTFKYFNAEYRAWVVGFQAEHRRLPTNAEAMGRIRDQFDPNLAYGPTTEGALENPTEAQKLFDFVKSVTGLDVNADNVREIVNDSNPDRDWKTLSVWDAPTGVGNLDNH